MYVKGMLSGFHPLLPVPNVSEGRSAPSNINHFWHIFSKYHYFRSLSYCYGFDFIQSDSSGKDACFLNTTLQEGCFPGILFESKIFSPQWLTPWPIDKWQEHCQHVLRWLLTRDLWFCFTYLLEEASQTWILFHCLLQRRTLLYVGFARVFICNFWLCGTSIFIDMKINFVFGQGKEVNRYECAWGAVNESESMLLIHTSACLFAKDFLQTFMSLVQVWWVCPSHTGQIWLLQLLWNGMIGMHEDMLLCAWWPELHQGHSQK